MKCLEYSRNFRKKLISAIGIDEYHKQMAEQAKQWRDNNPEKMKEIYDLQKLDVNKKYYYYKYSAEKRKIEFGLNLEQCMELFNDCCFYCGEKDEKYMNGIDRIDNDDFYTLGNVVPCCEVCNVMKTCLSVDVFIGRVEHILTYLAYINGQLNYNLFADYGGTSYDMYKNKANRKNLDFKLNYDEFYEITSNECYICGKQQNNDRHGNGIDRFDNKLGYTLNNSKSCCANCNYMKNKYNYNRFIDKLLKIYYNSGNLLNYDFELTENTGNNVDMRLKINDKIKNNTYEFNNATMKKKSNKASPGNEEEKIIKIIKKDNLVNDDNSKNDNCEMEEMEEYKDLLEKKIRALRKQLKEADKLKTPLGTESKRIIENNLNEGITLRKSIGLQPIKEFLEQFIKDAKTNTERSRKFRGKTE